MTRRRHNLSRHLVESLPAEPAILWDNDCRGLGIRVWASGYRAYVVQAREPSGRIRRATLTDATRYTDIRTVRLRASDAIVAIRRGAATIPGCARSRPKETAVTFAAVAERFMAEHGAIRKKASSVAVDRVHLVNHLLPAIGEKPIGSITRQDVAELHLSMSGKPVSANRVLALASTIFTFADRAGLVPPGFNPCRGIERYKERPRERVLSTAEMVRLHQALDAAAEHPSALLAIRLLIVTGARRGEVLGLLWSDVDFDAETARLRDSKTGPKTLYLGPAGTALLRAAPREAGNDRVCWGIHSLTPPWHRIRAAAGLDDVHLHDLRHGLATAAVAAGIGLPVVGRLLGHSTTSMTSRYAHTNDAAAREAIGRIQHVLTPPREAV